MAIYLQCKEEKIRNLLVRTEMVLYENKKSLNGYVSGLSENVRKQVEAIYTVISSMPVEELVSGSGDSEVIVGDWFPYDPAAAESIRRSPEKLQALAAYSLGMFHETRLHGLLIPAKSDLLVGVWLYKDYDYGEPIIRSQELIDEAYDKGGMMLPFSCTAMLLGKSFSEAVSIGCRLLKDYIYAVDLNLENKDVFGSIYRTFEKNPGENGLEGELLSSGYECETAEINPIAEAFRTGYEEEIHGDSVGIMKVSGERKTDFLLENIYEYLKNGKTLLIVSRQGTDPQISETLKKDGFDHFVWLEKNQEGISESREDGNFSEAIFNEAIRVLRSLPPKESNKKVKLLQRRCEENQNKLNQYLEMLESETVEGITLISLLETASETEDSQFSSSFGNAEKKIVFGSDLRRLFADYIKAWKECCYIAPDDEVCFDLTELTQDEISQLKEMADTSEVVITRFLEKLNEYGYAVHKIYRPDGRESQKEYFKSVMHINDFMLACTDLLNGLDAYELPKATSEELQAVDEYGHYIQYRKIYEAAGNTVDLSKIAVIEDENLKKLEEITNRLLKSDLDSVSIPIPRQMVRDSMDLEKMLRDNNVYTSAESLKCKAGADKNTTLKAVCEALTQPELIRRFAEDHTYTDVYDFFGANHLEHGYLFWLQRELVRYYMEVMSDANVEAETREILNGMMGCIVNRTAFNTQQTMLLNQAVELFSDYYTPFHDMEKEIFGFLNLSYQSFDHKFPDRMLMEFILDWKELLEMDQQYDNYTHESAAMERHYLSDIVNQIRKLGLSPEEAQEEFDHFWIREAAAFWVEQLGFDYMDYEMTTAGLKNCEKQLQAEERVQLYNSLLAERQKRIDECGEYTGQISEILLSIYPVFVVKPDTAAEITEAPGVFFDHMIIADGDTIPFYHILRSIEKTEALTILTPEEMIGEVEDENESVGHRALRMGFPVI